MRRLDWDVRDIDRSVEGVSTGAKAPITLKISSGESKSWKFGDGDDGFKGLPTRISV